VAHDRWELIELWSRADRACEDTRDLLAIFMSRLATSEALVSEHPENVAEIQDRVARTRYLVARWRQHS